MDPKVYLGFCANFGSVWDALKRAGGGAEGFEPSIRFWRILTFQASAFDHSATAPHALEGQRPRRVEPLAQGVWAWQGVAMNCLASDHPAASRRA